MLWRYRSAKCVLPAVTACRTARGRSCGSSRHINSGKYVDLANCPSPLPEDPQPSWNGYSVGRWEGDTLVVETNGLRDGIWLDRAGAPLTDAARVTERFRRIKYGT